MSNATAIQIGTSGWSYPHWHGVLYPSDLPPARRLAHYMQRFQTAELLPVWGRLPNGSRFSVKAPRGLTHARRRPGGGRREELLRRTGQAQSVPAVVCRRNLHGRASGSGQSGRTYGADLRLATSRFLGGQRNFIVDAYGVRSENRNRSGSDWSYGFSAHSPNDKYLAQFTVRDIQENFRPALGFVQRNNVRMLRAAASFNPRPRKLLNIQQMNHDLFYTRFVRLDTHEVESWDVYVTWWDWHFNSGDNIHGLFDFNRRYERLFEPFEISPGVVLTPGEYRFTRLRSNLFSTAAKRRLSGSAAIAWGNYWSGKAEPLTASVTYKAPPRFIFSLSSNQTFARLADGHCPNLHIEQSTTRPRRHGHSPT
jgi:hypothetical protein